MERHDAVTSLRCGTEIRQCRSAATLSQGIMASARTKLSGAELAAQLGDLAVLGARPTEPAMRPEDVSPAPPAKARGGRPAKAGADGVPVNVRLAQDDHLALARIAAELMVPGRPMPTLQDVVRGLIRGALKDPERLKRLVRAGRG